ncbi:hypothetical protein [Labilibaculum euxinus]|uniref:Uncharacterized protein n=1 Tax=Labilibaculum euxinus TaxID=2686357 RepID=A0A7M4D2E5_9BACT|nr:hypothetical protein [Labilibaculum euxinus]MUP36824.1 hypothetical protein [Labilibaculum euxinus]MVB06029.1 hypothetical protein [Labilibaculum euxinus]
MAQILDASNGEYRIVINKGILGHKIDLYKNGDIMNRLRCSKGKGKDAGVFTYMPLNSISIGVIIDYTLENRIEINVTNRGEISITY